MRDWNEKLDELRAQFDEQNAELEQVWATLGGFGDNVELSIPQAVLDEIDEASSLLVAEPQAPICGLRA